MKQIWSFFFLMALCMSVNAQKVEKMVFNLYTDSLKKGFYNYISVDGRFADGNWLPLDTTQIRFSANTGHFKGNDLFIDSAYNGDSVVVAAALRSNPAMREEVVIYIRKRGFTEPLKTAEEIMQDQKRGSKRKTREMLTASK